MYYLHQYLIQQPDLNYRNPMLRQEMLDALQYWINIGVDGFRIDAIIHLVEDAQFRNDPINPNFNGPNNDYNYLQHIYDVNQVRT